MINNRATTTNTRNAFISNLKCIKIVSTRYDLTEAIIKAAAIVKAPKLIPAMVTVTPVRTSRDIHTYMYMLYP